MTTERPLTSVPVHRRARVAAVVVAAFLGACGGGRAAVSPIVVPSSTTSAPTPPVFGDQTSATTATTARVPVSISQATVDMAFAQQLSAMKPRIGDILRGASVAEPVRDLSYDARANVVTVALAPAAGLATPAFVADQAWRVGKALARWFWGQKQVVAVVETRGGNVAMLPRLEIRLGGAAWVCPPQVMNALDNKRLNRAGWLAACHG